ncbi:hypothetical protein L9F63_015750 [Diploptera punctata]|uniref:Gelsolin-like domain-containing protein n=1 Tax=Diploptera punctata TaxID=6984 RepID=A0AAD8A5K6_DIPPU|nr:hypothetical protein L9F63_015750 [Diploptera punctata]
MVNIDQPVLVGLHRSECTIMVSRSVFVALALLCACFVLANAAVSVTSSTKRPVVQDPAFSGAGTQPGLQIWRVERFNVVSVPAEKHGKFHIGDSYLVLNTKNNRRSWDIHSWHGNETSNDESAVAAMKMVELDNLLGGGPVQHREDQGEESQMFRNYFPNGIEYLPGGVASGLRHVPRPN